MNLQYSELMSEYLTNALNVRGFSSHTVRGYQSDLEQFERWLDDFGADVSTITYRQLRGYLAYLSQAGYSKTTIGRRLSTVRSFFSFLVSIEKRSDNPAALLRNPKTGRPLPKALTASEIDALFSVISTDTPEGARDLALLEFMYATGARVAEVSGVVLSDVDYHQGTVLLRGKGSKERIVPLYPLAVKTLEHYCAHARPQLGQPSSDSIFLSTRGNQMSPEAIRRVLKKYCIAAGLPSHVSPHSLRHTFASDLLKNGANLRSVQELLGHENLSTTQVYTHLTNAHLKAVHQQTHPRG